MPLPLWKWTPAWSQCILSEDTWRRERIAPSCCLSEGITFLPAFPLPNKVKSKCQDSLRWQKFDSQTGSINNCVNGAHAEPSDWFTRSSLGLLMQTPFPKSEEAECFSTLWLTKWARCPLQLQFSLFGRHCSAGLQTEDFLRVKDKMKT